MRLIYKNEPGALAAAVELAKEFEITSVTHFVKTLYPEGNIPPQAFDICSDAMDILKDELPKQRQSRRA